MDPRFSARELIRQGPSAAVAAGCTAALALTATALALPDLLGVNLLLPAGREVVVWTVRARAIAAVGLLLWALACWFAWRSARRGASRIADAVLLPLTLLPLSLFGFFLRPHVPQEAAANLLFFLPVFLTSISLFRWLRRIDANGNAAALPPRGALVVGVGFWVLYALTGSYFTVSMVKPPGDTGHYLVQAESLYRDRDLDLRNNLGIRAEQNPEYWHISRFSRGGHLYSWHSIGLSLLLAPFVPANAPARHLMLGLLAGLCCAGVWELCRLFGAAKHWSLTALLLFALSRYWGLYSSLTLPEVAGAALTTWGVVAILRQRVQPWGSGWVCAACCAALPWLHTRFIPVSAAIFGVYVLDGLARRDPWRPALFRLGAVTATYGVAIAVFVAVQLAMFVGGLPLPGGLLLSNPLGIWHGVAHRLGLMSVLPLFAGMLGAAVWILFRDAPNRRGASVVLLLAAVVLVTSSGTVHWRGGAAFPGRFLVVVAPLFVPCLARALGHANPVARWWVIFLGLIPCFQFVLVLAGLPEMGDASLLFDHLDGLMEYVASNDDSALQPFALVLLLGTGSLFFLGPGRRRLAFTVTAAMSLVVAAFGEVAPSGQLSKFKEAFNARRLAELGSRLEHARILTRGEAVTLDLFQVSNRFHRERLPAVIDREAEPAQSNDWAGRGYRWATLAPAFDAGPGWRAYRLSGHLADGTTAHWAVREGPDTLFEGPLAAGPDGAVAGTVQIRCRGRGRIVLLVRFDEERGSLQDPAIAWTPFSPGLLEKGGFRISGAGTVAPRVSSRLSGFEAGCYNSSWRGA